MIKAGCVNIDTSHPGTLAAVMRDNNCDMYYHGVYNEGFRTDNEVGSIFLEIAGKVKIGDC